MSIEEIIVVIELLADGAEECAIDPREPKAERKIHERRSKALREAVALLRTHPEAQPNEPLTIEDLLNMSGRPVWIEDSALGKEWAIVGCPSHMKKLLDCPFLTEILCGRTRFLGVEKSTAAHRRRSRHERDKKDTLPPVWRADHRVGFVPGFSRSRYNKKRRNVETVYQRPRGKHRVHDSGV